MTTLVFSLTLFVSSCLLFLVEPMFAKMVLPLLGGSPAVWNTCMLFFQVTLLAGYAYAHVVISRLRPRSQIPVHLLVILLPLAVLPVAIGPAWNPPVDGNPVAWLVLLMLVSVGLPFFAISTTASVIQKWFSQSGDKSAGDPYFLYVASNAGGIVGLIGYIVVVEPNLTLAQQSRVWSVGYGALILLTVACAVFLAKQPRPTPDLPADPEAAKDTVSPPIPLAHKLRWVALAFAPSSLMLGVTTFISTNIAAIPLLWVIPLTIYLLTFVVAFSRRSLIPVRLAVRLLPIVAVLVLIILAEINLTPDWIPSLIHLFAFFVAALACHGQLAQDRPHTRHLTSFYLMIAVGGALGGVFNAIVAPLVFKTTAEHTIALIAACMLCGLYRPKTETKPGTAAARSFNRVDILLPFALGVMTAALLLGAYALRPRAMPTSIIVIGVLTGILCYALVKRPIRFGLGIAAVILASSLAVGHIAPPLHLERSFFGISRVSTIRARSMRILFSGNTLHGMQCIVPGERRTPRAYHYPTGPIGQVFAAFSGKDARRNVAVTGLGTGALAGYADRGQTFTFYEIDPAVERIALEPRYFTYLKDARSRGADVRVVLGDGRLSIARAPDGAFDLIVLDAFSSDAVPTHLVTRQALRVYLSKLSRGGLIAVNVTNKFLDIAPVIGDLAADADLVCLRQDDYVSMDELRRGKSPSSWVAMARRSEDLGSLFLDPRWELVAARPGARVWTDDYSNIFQVFRWH